MSRNRILAALPAAERERLLARLEPWSAIACATRSTSRASGCARSCSRSRACSRSWSWPDNGDAPVEIATVGHEGFVGLPVFLQATLTGAHMAFSQVEGEALRMDAADFLDAVNDAPALRTALQRYAMALMTQIGRSAACNRLHSVEQRASRWILQTHDRVEADAFDLRAEFLAQMLGEPRWRGAGRRARWRAGRDRLRRRRAGGPRPRGARAAPAATATRVVRDEYERLLAPVTSG